MTTSLIVDIVSGALLLVGSALALIAAIGLVRFPDVLTRMHAATKPQTLGLLLVLAGLALRIRDPGALAIIGLVALFQLVTAPVSAHMVARAAFRTGVADTSRLERNDLD
ncbi:MULTISPECIES: monovalent cation/H(+) antiporter subunit G [unclassified Aeromicrobium]|jgi:multicomponent Na+:H+ antiporter subunit G|uniref:monovalent cation/H(+) antiporter subunit G n=1 Tax=unclassified Aeromicrobium TaxID=2633570 RepID=UPI0010EB1195|nr:MULTISPECIES: monovalent cation/H(+) antiporter subunit G [unclassified Aeromicrobium]RYY45127.1 MAG: monovalent cation/H(+) antiporter subunit G [Actinomycetales bacterium]